MGYMALERFLFRAPLLPVGIVKRSRVGLSDYRWADAALALASPELADAAAAGASAGKETNPRVALALDRYRRRAAFRPTPHGLWAGIGIGTLANRTRVASNQPEPCFRVAWARLAEMARDALDSIDVRSHVRLRRAPSVNESAHTVLWLATELSAAGDQRSATLVEKHAVSDEVLAAVLSATVDWTPWVDARSAVDPHADPDEVDELLLNMIDDGLLHTDLVPPLLGPLPEDWLAQRLRQLPAASILAAHLNEARTAARAGDWRGLRLAIDTASAREPSASAIEATLRFPSAAFSLSRAGVTRAAALAPLLFALQEALTPPASERVPDGTLDDALDATTELFGAGALDPAALQVGDYGVPAGDPSDAGPVAPGGSSPPRELLTLLVDRIVTAARERAPAIDFTADDLASVVGDGPALPATCELFVTPCRTVPGAAAGTNWLLGLHAPAGSSWGRFAHALGDEAASLLEPLRAAEQRARPGEERLDVVFAPGPEVADVCAHPPLRARALALTSWPSDDVTPVTLADLELCADAAALEPLALRTTAGQPVAPSALHRVRSALAPAGVWRLLLGWSLYRQHAPWAVIFGPLGALEWTPRIAIEGFVVAPSSWRLPPGFANRTATVGDLDGWRRRARPPRFVQVGAEDELLPVDLTAPTALADLLGHERVFEIWPPLGDTPDLQGRRVEAVIALVDDPDAEKQARNAAAVAATAHAGRVPPPRRGRAATQTDLWRTYKLFGLADHQDHLLVDVIAPAIAEARSAAEITGWFFLRYVDGPGQRPHLRLRVRADARGEARFTRRLARWLAPDLDAGVLVMVERASYFPESARFGGPESLPSVHALFEADSDSACALLTREAAHHAAPDGDLQGDGALFEHEDARVICLVAAFDSLVAAFGLGASARLELAQRRLDAHVTDNDVDSAVDVERAHGRAFRKLGASLRQLLAGAADPVLTETLRKYQQAVRPAVVSIAEPVRAQILAPLLHLSAVRLVGADPSAEMRAYSYWARALTSLARHPFPPP